MKVSICDKCLHETGKLIESKEYVRYRTLEGLKLHGDLCPVHMSEWQRLRKTTLKHLPAFAKWCGINGFGESV